MIMRKLVPVKVPVVSAACSARAIAKRQPQRVKQYNCRSQTRDSVQEVRKHGLPSACTNRRTSRCTRCSDKDLSGRDCRHVFYKHGIPAICAHSVSHPISFLVSDRYYLGLVSFHKGTVSRCPWSTRIVLSYVGE